MIHRESRIYLNKNVISRNNLGVGILFRKQLPHLFDGRIPPVQVIGTKRLEGLQYARRNPKAAFRVTQPRMRFQLIAPNKKLVLHLHTITLRISNRNCRTPMVLIDLLTFLRPPQICHELRAFLLPVNVTINSSNLLQSLRSFHFP